MSYPPEVWDDLRQRDAEATARTVIDTLAAAQDVEAPLSPEAVLESWKFACAGWMERALAAEARLAACPPPEEEKQEGCERHRGDPHNLCEACWAVEPDPATISVTQGGIGDTKGFFLPPPESSR